MQEWRLFFLAVLLRGVHSGDRSPSALFRLPAILEADHRTRGLVVVGTGLVVAFNPHVHARRELCFKAETQFCEVRGFLSARRVAVARRDGGRVVAVVVDPVGFRIGLNGRTCTLRRSEFRAAPTRTSRPLSKLEL